MNGKPTRSLSENLLRLLVEGENNASPKTKDGKIPHETQEGT